MTGSPATRTSPTLDCCSLLAVPILSRGSLRAVLLLENRLIRGAFTTDRLDAVKLIAGQLAVSLDNAQLYAELTASRARIVAAADHARRRIERDLHDGAQQRLVSLALRLRAAQAAVPPEAGRAGGAAGRAGRARRPARWTSCASSPAASTRAVLAEGGLCPALTALARRTAVPVELDCRVEGRLPEQVEIAAYYVVAEALTNAAKHAARLERSRSRSTPIEGESTDVLRVAVRDDGRGGADLAGGTGLLGLKDRVEALGGRILLDSPTRSGHHPARRAPAHRHEQRRNLPLVAPGNLPGAEHCLLRARQAGGAPGPRAGRCSSQRVSGMAAGHDDTRPTSPHPLTRVTASVLGNTMTDYPLGR